MIKRLHALAWLFAAANMISYGQSSKPVGARGGSFGLENFLMQSFDDENFNGDMNIDLEKETPKSSMRGQTYGLESMTEDLYPTQEPPDRRRPQHRHGQPLNFRSDGSSTAEKGGHSENHAEMRVGFSKETVRKPLERPITFRKTDLPEDENRQERVTGRPRKRIAMRRRKRPPIGSRSSTETQTENLVLEQSSENNLFSSTTSKPFTEVLNESKPEQEQQFQQAKRRPMGFRVHAKDKDINVLDEKKSAIVKIEIEADGEKDDNVKKDLRLDDSSLTEETDATQVKSFNKLKLFLRKHQSGVSLSELLQTRNLSLTDILSGNKQDVVVDSDVTSESPSTSYHHSQNVRSRHDIIPTRPPSIPSIASRPFSKNENTGGYRYTKKKYKQESGNHSNKETDKEASYDESIKNHTRKFHKNSERVDREEVKDSLNNKKSFRDNEPNKEGYSEEHPAKNSTENRKLSTSLFNYRRKLKIPNDHQPAENDLEPVIKLSSNAEQVSPSPITSTSEANDKGYLRRNIKTPFKSSNNPELALIFPHQKKKDRITGIKFPNLNSAKKESTENEQDGKTTVRPRDKDLVANEQPIEEDRVLTDSFGSDKDLVTNKQSVGNTTKETESMETAEPNKDEILELLKSAATAQKLEKILASRNMTIAELLLNREKGSIQTNFSSLFSSQKENRDTTNGRENRPSETSEKHDDSKKIPPVLFDLMETNESNPVVKRLHFAQNENKETTKRLADHILHDFGQSSGDRARVPKKSGIDGFYKRGETVGDHKLPADDENRPIAETNQQELETRFGSEISAAEEAWNAKIIPENQNGYLTHEYPPTSETEKHSEQSYIPPVIKSTIIISSVVMGIALLVFIAIFAACGWRQRQLRLKADSSILKETLTKKKKARTTSPIEIKRSTSTYKKTLDFDDSRSVLSVSSEASSYLWNTLKNTFTSRNKTLKNERQACLDIRGGPNKSQAVNQRIETNKYEERLNSLRRENEKYCPAWQKSQSANKDLIRTTDSFKRGVLNTCGNIGRSHRFDNWTQN